MDMNEKMLRAKQKLMQRGRGDSAREVDIDYGDPRVPPGQHLVNNWPVLDLGFKPELSLDDWTLTIDGQIENPVTWNWEEFQAQPSKSYTTDFHCVTSWSRLDNEWVGVSFQHVCSIVRPLPSAQFLFFEAYDDYTTNLPLSVCQDDDVFLAVQWNHLPLSKDHGGPVRLIIPKLYAWKGAKWIKKITFTEQDQKGFWEIRGYSNTARPWQNDRYG
ncbi:MAG: sulfite oxidase-like oxidoreductase [Nitrospirales bacterium]|nr:MAG: sulfite oxidase-like oxidoreductase [Nitrospirales bacterium]